jgi:hypothetical protein
VNQNTETEIDDDDARSGTGPCCWYREGTTASVVDIISSKEVNNPLVHATRTELTMPVLFSSSMLRDWAEAACRPGHCSLMHVYTSTKKMVRAPVPTSTPPSGHNCRLKRIRPRRMGGNARSDAKRFRSQTYSSPPVCKRVRPYT